MSTRPKNLPMTNSASNDKHYFEIHLFLFFAYIVQGVLQLILEFTVKGGARYVYITFEESLGGIANTTKGYPVGWTPGMATYQNPIQALSVLIMNAMANPNTTFAGDGISVGIPFNAFSPVALTGSVLILSALGNVVFMCYDNKDTKDRNDGRGTYASMVNLNAPLPLPVSPLRPFVYGVTSTLMMMVVVIVCGVKNLPALLFMVGLQLGVCFLGYVFEVVNHAVREVAKDNTTKVTYPSDGLMTPTLLTMGVMSTIQWVAIVFNLWTTSVDQAAVFPLVIVMGVFNFLYGLCTLLMYNHKLITNKEYVFMAFDFITNTTLSWMIFGKLKA